MPSGAGIVAGHTDLARVPGAVGVLARNADLARVPARMGVLEGRRRRLADQVGLDPDLGRVPARRSGGRTSLGAAFGEKLRVHRHLAAVPAGAALLAGLAQLGEPAHLVVARAVAPAAAAPL